MKKILICDDALAWVEQIAPFLSKETPREITDDSSGERAARLEMETRSLVSLRLVNFIEGYFTDVPDPLVSYFIRQRLDWAARAIMCGVTGEDYPEASFDGLLRWCLVDSWNTRGCVDFWYRTAERQGTDEVPCDRPMPRTGLASTHPNE